MPCGNFKCHKQYMLMQMRNSTYLMWNWICFVGLRPVTWGILSYLKKIITLFSLKLSKGWREIFDLFIDFHTFLLILNFSCLLQSILNCLYMFCIWLVFWWSCAENRCEYYRDPVLCDGDGGGENLQRPRTPRAQVLLRRAKMFLKNLPVISLLNTTCTFFYTSVRS